MNYYKLDHEATVEDLNDFNFPNQKLGVIIHIENENGEILLQKRGKQSRDAKKMYENIGGKYEDNDISFKTAIIRELAEEAGTDVNIDINNTIGIFHCCKQDTNWVFLIFLGKYINGNIQIMEPNKCEGYHFFTYNELIQSDMVTRECKYLTKSLKKNM